MATSNQFNFSNRGLTAIEAPTDRASREYGDTKTQYLKLEVSASGVKTFWFRAQRNGRRFAERIGRFPAITLDEARLTAREMTSQLERGEDPSEKRKSPSNTLTFGQFFHDQYLPHAKVKKTSWRDDLNRFKLRISPIFGERSLDSINRREIDGFHASLKSEVSPTTANRFLTLMSAVFRRAVEWGVMENNPCTGIKQFPENNQRTRFLSVEEVSAFLAACDAEAQSGNRPAAMLLKGLLFTGLRKSELKNARWDDVNLQRGELHLRATKNGHSRTVVLSEAALEIIQNLPSLGKSAWLFPGRDETAPLNNLDKPFARICKLAGLANTGFTIHCLRHTLASHMAMQGKSLHVIGQTLGHRTVAMTARYSHISNPALRSAVNEVGEIFLNAQDRKDSAVQSKNN